MSNTVWVEPMNVHGKTYWSFDHDGKCWSLCARSRSQTWKYAKKYAKAHKLRARMFAVTADYREVQNV